MDYITFAIPALLVIIILRLYERKRHKDLNIKVNTIINTNKKEIIKTGKELLEIYIKNLHSYQDIEDIDIVTIVGFEYLIAKQVSKEFYDEIKYYYENLSSIDPTIISRILEYYYDEQLINILLHIIESEDIQELLDDKLTSINQTKYDEAMRYEKSHPEGFNPDLDGYDHYDKKELDNFMEYKALTAKGEEENMVDIVKETVYDPNDNTIEFYDMEGNSIKLDAGTIITEIEEDEDETDILEELENDDNTLEE